MKQPNGYILLISVLIVAAVSTSIIAALVIFGVAHERTALSLQQGIEARALADACADNALERLISDVTYTGGDTITIGTQSCSVPAISGSGDSNRTIQASSTVGEATKRVEVVVTTVGPPPTVSQWKEVAEFSF